MTATLNGAEFRERSRRKAESPEVAALEEKNDRLQSEVNALRGELQATLREMRSDMIQMSSRREPATAPSASFNIPNFELKSSSELNQAIQAISQALGPMLAAAMKNVTIQVNVNPTPIVNKVEPPTIINKVSPTPVNLTHKATYQQPAATVNVKSEVKMPRTKKVTAKYRKSNGEDILDHMVHEYGE